MIDLLLQTAAGLTLAIWLLQELYIRRQVEQTWLSSVSGVMQEPSWFIWLSRGLAAVWIAWVVMILRYKDGDFSFVLVILTFLSGFVLLLEKSVFEKRRALFLKVPAVQDKLKGLDRVQQEQVEASVEREAVTAEYANSFFPVLVLVLILRSFLIEPFQIPSGSMLPTLEKGDFILVNKFHYGLRLPVLGTKVMEFEQVSRGDVMVFKFPDNPKINYIKRVVGLPGDVIRYENKRLFVNGEYMSQEHVGFDDLGGRQFQVLNENLDGVKHTIYKMMNYPFRHGEGEWTVPEGHYFALGDNRDNSKDGRYWGFVPDKLVVGKAFAVWLHWDSFLSIPRFDRNKIIE